MTNYVEGDVSSRDFDFDALRSLPEKNLSFQISL